MSLSWELREGIFIILKMSLKISKSNRTVVVALGGNAITREFEEGNIFQQFANTRRSPVGVAEIVGEGNNVIITHGNGPQVGNALIRVEEARHFVPPIPLGVLVADTESGMGYMIEKGIEAKRGETGTRLVHG